MHVSRRHLLALCTASSLLLAHPLTHAASAARRLSTPNTPLDIPSNIAQFAQNVVVNNNAEGRTFGVLDKPTGLLWVFNPQGTLLDRSTVLVGQASGDVEPPDIGSRPLSAVKPHEKVTPAGRFVTEPGKNHKGDDIVWLNYASALSMHRVRNVPGENRLDRLASTKPGAGRISFGCVNVPETFFDRVVAPYFRQQSGVMYILPEELPLQQVFPFASAFQPGSNLPTRKLSTSEYTQ